MLQLLTHMWNPSQEKKGKKENKQSPRNDCSTTYGNMKAHSPGMDSGEKPGDDQVKHIRPGQVTT